MNHVVTMLIAVNCNNLRRWWQQGGNWNRLTAIDHRNLYLTWTEETTDPDVLTELRDEYQQLVSSGSQPFTDASGLPDQAKVQPPASEPLTVQPSKPGLVPEGEPSRAVPQEVLAFLGRWQSSMLQHDLETQVDCYAPLVERYFRQLDVPQGQVRAGKESMFAAYPDIRVYAITDVQVESTGSDRMSVTFRKEWDARGLKQFAGAERERLTLARFGGVWKIVCEQELQVFWVRGSAISGARPIGHSR